MKKRKQPAKKPRTLNAVWADAQCWIYPNSKAEFPHKRIEVAVQTRNLSAKSALRLSRWLAEAAAWKGEA